MKSLDRPTLVDLELGNDWEITYNQLYNLDPTETGLYENNRFPVWAYFSEDLLQVKNERQGILLDVGWKKIKVKTSELDS